MIINIIEPDWTHDEPTLRDLRRYIGDLFQIKAEGWYKSKPRSLLGIPPYIEYALITKQKNKYKREPNKFWWRIAVYSEDPRPALRAILKLPERKA